MITRSFICVECKKLIKERGDLRGFTVDKVKEVELEYFNICDKCGAKRIKEQRFKLRIASSISLGIISYDLFNGWQNGAISKKDFLETLQDNERLFKKSQLSKKKKVII